MKSLGQEDFYHKKDVFRDKEDNIYQPKDFWDYFYEIIKIPRRSGEEAGIRNYITKEADLFGLQSEKDETGNLIIHIPAKNPNPIKIILQCHLDMVCVKTEDSNHNFDNDPITTREKEINNQKWIVAKDTTLGADNGVGIAYLLTLMRKIVYGELIFNNLDLKLLFTVNEETALVGAKQINKEFLKGTYLICLDGEKDDMINIGCTGGSSFELEYRIKRTKLPTEINTLLPLRINVTKLIGGHSGIDIDKRINAIKLLIDFLSFVTSKVDIFLNLIEGGSDMLNAIPENSTAIILIHKKDLHEFKIIREEFIANLRRIFKDIEPDFELSINEENNFTCFEPIEKKDQTLLLNTLNILPNGVFQRNYDSEKSIIISSNLSKIESMKNRIRVFMSQRSLSAFGLKLIFDKFKSIEILFKNKIKIKKYYEYINWEPNFRSELVVLSKNVYLNLFRKTLKTQIIHAGLECAYFKKHSPDLDLFSIGPTIQNLHSTQEMLKITSVNKIWLFLTELLKELNKSL